MQLGVLSDTHDNVDAIERAVDTFEDVGVDAVLHCGDFIAPPTIPYFEGFEFHGVLGNNDGELDGLEATIEGLGDGSQLHGRTATVSFDGLEMYMLHGDQGHDVVEERAETGDYDYVFYGHFHETERREIGDTVVINPGAHFPTVPAEHRNVVLMDTETGSADFVNITS